MCYEPISPRAGCAGPLAGWHGHFEQRVRFRSTRLCNEPISRVQATKIAIDSSGCAPRASAGVRRASIETLGSRFGLLGRSALYEGRANESLHRTSADRRRCGRLARSARIDHHHAWGAGACR